MIVFSSHQFQENTRNFIRNFRVTAEEIINASYNHNKVTKLLIEYGDFETAVSDLLAGNQDSALIPQTLRKAGKLTGYIFKSSMKQNPKLLTYTREFLQTMSEIEHFKLPEKIITKIPEGYAYYGVYPEMYYQAAECFYSQYKPKKCIIIGLRSIGTSLSSIVWSALPKTNTYSFTLRPHGDPFDRKVNFSASERELILRNPDSYFLIVDEGPGLSGSSFAGTADELIKLGIPIKRIILFPSRMTSGEDLISEKAKYYWKNLDKRFVSFNEFWMESGKFASITGGYQYEEISAGNWRDIFLKEKSQYPAVFEQFERRKFILRSEDKDIQYFVKFVGLGKYGEWVFQNSTKFADAGFSPEVYKFDQGFIFYKYVRNTQVYNYNLPELVNFVIKYLLFIEKNFQTEPSYSYDEMKEMIYHNTKEVFNQEFVNKIMSINFDKSLFTSAVKNDGRMLPHEWIYNGRFLKSDNAEHYFDHLYPGSQDITWDIASFLIEFGFTEEQRSSFMEKYCAVSKDKYINDKLNFIMLEYLAFRIGYCSFAASNSFLETEKDRFKKLVKSYSEKLREKVDIFS